MSELDTCVLRMTGTNYEIKVWDHLTLHSSFMVPCDELSFTISDEDQTLATELLVPGAPLQLTVNGKPQFTGYLDKKRTSVSRNGGTVITCSARDILGPVINSNVAPKIRFSGNETLLDFVVAVLVPLGIKTIYNDGSLNVNLQTGAAQKPKLSSASVSAQLPKASLASDGSITNEFETVTATSKSNSAKTDLKTLKIKQLKPHDGEGAYQFVDRILKRLGYRMWAAADGSGVIIDKPDFTSKPTHTLIHSRTSETTNIESAELHQDWESQPSCFVATGVGGTEANLDRRSLAVVCINELVGTDANGEPLQEIKNIIATYPGAVVLPLRKQLIPDRKGFAESLIARPMFGKDKDAHTADQLAAFARREMSARQHKAFQLKVTITGLSLDGVPFAPNTNVIVKDDVLGISKTLWVMEREFEKTREGTRTSITLVLPFTVDLTGSST